MSTGEDREFEIVNANKVSVRMKRVVITGIGTLSPLGNNTADTWAALRSGKSGIATVTRFDVVGAGFNSHIAGEVKDFDPVQFVEAKEVKKLDIFSQYAIAASDEAWNDAGLATLPCPPERIGCILGVGMGGLGTLEKYHEAYMKSGPRRISPFLIPAMISNLGPGNVAIRYGMKGVNFAVSSACTSSTHAIGEAYRMVASGVQDIMVTGGAESTITPIGIGGFAAMKALSTRNDAPEAASRPFDKGRDGFVIGEGSVILVLESLESAEKRGANVYAEVLGYGVSCDANHITAPCADGSGAIACMTGALESAGLKPEDVQYVNAHGTSTPVGDVAETRAIKQVFGDYAHKGLMVSSTKSMTGHLLGAAGAIEAAVCALATRDNVVPPTINLEDPEDGCDLDFVPHTAREVTVDIAMSNSFGFGGTNASVVVGKVK